MEIFRGGTTLAALFIGGLRWVFLKLADQAIHLETNSKTTTGQTNNQQTHQLGEVLRGANSATNWLPQDLVLSEQN